MHWRICLSMLTEGQHVPFGTVLESTACMLRAIKRGDFDLESEVITEVAKKLVEIAGYHESWT